MGRVAGSEGTQRYWTGLAGGRQASHDAAVYRAAALAAGRIRGAGGTVTRVVIDSEFRSVVARRVEKARAAGGDAAAVAEAARVADELRLPCEAGKLHYPDARLEHEDAAGRVGSTDIEVATDHYRAATVRGKAARGFAVYQAGGLGRAAARGGLSVPGGGDDGGGGGGGGGGRGDEGLLDL